MNIVKNCDRKGSADHGMTLVESVMAVMVLSVGIAGAASLIVQSSKLTDMARDHYVAVSLCRNRLETARTLDYGSLTSMEEASFVCNANGGQSDAGSYKRITVVSSNYLSCSSLTEVKVTVKIKDRKTLAFSNESETVQSLYTWYQAP